MLLWTWLFWFWLFLLRMVVRCISASSSFVEAITADEQSTRQVLYNDVVSSKEVSKPEIYDLYN